ncbi:MAG: iron-siderophore ABC transporter substrate-binding protein [Pseudonocardiaceae bacterium]
MTNPTDDPVGSLAGRAALGRRGRALHPRPLSRRLFLAGAAAGAASLSLAACGNGGNSSAAAPSGAAGFPVTLTGKEGTATISAPPEQVVALGFQRDAETALALGVTPIAMTASVIFPSGIAPWAEAVLTNRKPELLNTANGFPFEKIAALRPDVILATDSYELTDAYDRLTQIAPTVSYVEGPDSDTWQQRVELIGKALGRAEQAKQVLADTQNKINQAATDNPAFAGKTFSFSYVAGGVLEALVGDDASVTFLEQLGLTISPKLVTLPESEPGRAPISRENLGVLDAEVMIATAQTDEDRELLESNPLFSQLNAVKNGNFILIPFPVSVATGFPSPLSIPYALDNIVPAVAKILA